MTRRGRLISILATLALVATLPLFSACGSQPKAADFADFWREPGATSPSMYIDSAGDDSLAVRYDRFYPTAVRFHYEDGKLSYAPVSPEFTDVITYDAGADTVTITNGNGESHTLSRVRP